MTEAIIINRLDDANDFLKKNRSLLILTSVLLLGMLLGSWSISLCDNNNYYGVDDIFINYLSKRSGQPFIISFLYSFLSSLPLFLSCYIFGLCIIGSPTAVLLPLLKGFGIGISAGYLYSVYGIKGIGFFALIMLPRLFISSAAIIFAARETLRFSTKLFKIILPNNKSQEMFENFKIYSIRYIVLLSLLVFSSLIDAIMSVAFINFFSF